MAILIDADRKEIWATYMRDLSARQESIDLVKADLRAMFNAVDQWVDDNAASFNSALPEPAKSTLSAKQKADILARVIMKRFEVA